MKSADLVVTEKAQKGFYPTPLSLGGRLLAGIDWKMVSSVLEPSAGKGNLLIALADGWLASRGRYDGKVDVDCIEIDPHLRSILLYEFGGQHEEEMCQRMNVLKGKAEWDYRTQSRGQLTPEEIEEKKALENEQDRRRVISFHMIHDDFLTFGSRKRYDLIVMNPPFEDGDVHLLRAIEYQERSGGMVRCILNAETIRNPYTNRRKLLREKLVAIGAEIEFVDGAFSEAERQTDVSVAIIKATIPAPKQDSSIFDRLQKAAHLDEGPVQNVTEMAVTDFLEQIVSRFNVEVDAGLELIREYEAMRPYLLNSFDEEDKYRTPTLTLCAGDPSRHFRGDGPKINEFLQLTRAKYWGALFSNKEFIGIASLEGSLADGTLANIRFLPSCIEQVVKAVPRIVQGDLAVLGDDEVGGLVPILLMLQEKQVRPDCDGVAIDAVRGKGEVALIDDVPCPDVTGDPDMVCLGGGNQPPFLRLFADRPILQRHPLAAHILQGLGRPAEIAHSNGGPAAQCRVAGHAVPPTAGAAVVLGLSLLLPGGEPLQQALGLVGVHVAHGVLLTRWRLQRC